MQFTKPDYSEKNIFDEYFNKQNYGICDLTSGIIYMWANYFNYEYAVDSGALYLRGAEIYNKNNTAYLPPLNIGAEGIKKLIEEVKKDGEPLILEPVPEELVEEIQKNFNAEAIYLRDWSDYTYDAEELSRLAGKKLHKKRNLIYQFMADYQGYATEDITLNNCGEILTAFKSWKKTYGDSEMGKFEIDATEKVLENLDFYKFDGLALRVGGKIIAFSMGEKYGEIYFTHIEKADIDYKGVYQMINLEFCRKIKAKYPEIKYFNREEDMGDEGLRQTKESYYPAMLKNKYKLIIK